VGGEQPVYAGRSPQTAQPHPLLRGDLPASREVHNPHLRWVYHLLPPAQEAVAGPQTLSQSDRDQSNTENLLGTVKVPVGLAGPLRVNGLFAQGDDNISPWRRARRP